MHNIKINGDWVDIFDVCRAHQQLESDYNVGGIVRERPSNQRRNMSTGVQLHRMKFQNLYSYVDITGKRDESDDPGDENVRMIYMENVLKWNLPIDKPLAKQMKKYFTKNFLKPFDDRLKKAMTPKAYLGM